YISDFCYADAVSDLSVDPKTLFKKVVVALGVTTVYLIVSPWISYCVHLIQGKAISKYKIQSLKNDRDIFIEKQKMEKSREKALEMEIQNINFENDVKEAEERRLAGSSDAKKLACIISILSEEKIRDIFFDLESGS